MLCTGKCSRQLQRAAGDWGREVVGGGERGLPAPGLRSHRRCWGIRSLCQLPRDGLLGQLVNLRAGDGLKVACRLVSVEIRPAVGNDRLE